MPSRWKTILTSPVDNRTGSILAAIFTLLGAVALVLDLSSEARSDAAILGLEVWAFVAIVAFLLLAAGAVCYAGYRGLKAWGWLWIASLHPAVTLMSPGREGPGSASFSMRLYGMTLIWVGMFFIQRFLPGIQGLNDPKPNGANPEPRTDS